MLFLGLFAIAAALFLIAMGAIGFDLVLILLGLLLLLGGGHCLAVHSLSARFKRFETILSHMAVHLREIRYPAAEQTLENLRADGVLHADEPVDEQAIAEFLNDGPVSKT